MASGALVPLMCIIHRSYVCQVRYFPGLSVHAHGRRHGRQGLSAVSFCCFCVLLAAYKRGKIQFGRDLGGSPGCPEFCCPEFGTKGLLRAIEQQV